MRTYDLAGIPVAERTAKTGVTGSVLTWISGDVQHTQDLSVGASDGKMTRRYTDPFGNPRGTTAAWGSNHGFLNASSSAVTGLTQLGARAYDPAVGRFLSVDPVLDAADPAHSSGYSYAHNAPVTLSDPSGLKPSKDKSTPKSKTKSKTKAPPAGKTKPKQSPTGSKSKSSSKGSSAKHKEDWWNPFSWSGKTWQKVGAVAAGIAVGVAVTAAVIGAAACTAVTVGACGVAILAAGMIGGIASAATTYALQPGPKSVQGAVQAMTWGPQVDCWAPPLGRPPAPPPDPSPQPAEARRSPAFPPHSAA